MDNLSYLRLIELFIVNSEILLRSTSRKLNDTTCTLGARVTNSLCKSFYSTRCSNTTAAFNLFFQGDVMFYNENGTLRTDRIAFNDIYSRIAPNQIFTTETHRTQYGPALVDFCNSIMNIQQNIIITLSMAGPSSGPDPGVSEYLVGHIYNILRIRDGNRFRNYVIQGYIYKYSPICFEIDDVALRDHLIVYYAIRSRSTCMVPNLVSYNHFLSAQNAVYTMFIADQNTRALAVNPWINEKFKEFFKEYYYNPFINNNVTKEFGVRPMDIRTYRYVRMSIASTLPLFSCYYNMLSFMYVYYGIISYDLYIYRMQYLSTINPRLYGNPIKYRYIFSDFTQEVNVNTTDPLAYESNNPTFYIDDTLTTNNSHINIFWENNPYMRFSYILSNSNKVLIPGAQYTEDDINFIFDLYSTLLYSAKTAIMNVSSYIETVSCNETSIINLQSVIDMYKDTLISRYLMSSYNFLHRRLVDLPNALKHIYLPCHMMLNSFDMYDYYSDKSCIMYKIVIDTLNTIQDKLDRNDLDIINLLGHFQTIETNYLNLSQNQKDQLPERLVKLINNILIFRRNMTPSMIQENGSDRRPEDNTAINGYKSLILNPLISIIFTSLGFLLCYKVVVKLNSYYNTQRGIPINDTTNITTNLITYTDFIGVFYYGQIQTRDIFNQHVLPIFSLMYDIIDNIINEQYPSINNNTDQIAKPYSIFIKAIKNSLLQDIGTTEQFIIDEIRRTNPNSMLP